MPTIHPSATVDSQARLADDVVVGPQCVIEGDVSIGAGTRLVSQVYLHGPLTIGAGNRIYPFVTLGLPPQDLKYDPDHDGAGMAVGDENIIREGVSIHRATGDQPTTIGSRNYLMANSHLGHDVQMGDDCMLANGVLVAGHVEIGDKSIFGGNAGIHQFSRIGRLTMISGLSAVGKDIPPFCTVYYMTRTIGSLNLVGLRRSGYREHVKPLKRAFELLFCSNHTNSHAVELIDTELGDDPLCTEFAAFVRASKRGVARYAKEDD